MAVRGAKGTWSVGKSMLMAGASAAATQAAAEKYALQGTPTFYLNGKMITGETTLEALKAEIDPLLA